MLRSLDLNYAKAFCVGPESVYHLLQDCISRKDLLSGRRVQQLAVQDGLQASDFLATHIIRMFALCGSVSEANQAFVRLHTPSVYTWSAFLLAHSNSGLALPLYHCMLQSNVQPNAYCYTALLKACANPASLNKGMLLHDHIVQEGFDWNATVNNTLIDMYVKAGDLAHALAVFKNSCVQTVVTWTTIIAGYASSNACTTEAFELYQQMQQKYVSPNAVTFTSIMKACSSAIDGRLVHFHVVESGLDCNLFVGNALVDMYAEFGSIEEARFVFDHLCGRDVVTWSSIIEGYAEDGLANEALSLFTQMQQEVEPNKVTFVNLAKACTSLESLTLSNLIYGSVIEGGFNSDTLLGTALIDLYAKCGSFEDANVLFMSLPIRNVVTWTTMIAGYALHGDFKLAMKCYANMWQEGLRPNETTYLLLLSACNHLGLVHKGCTLFDTMALQGVTPTFEHHHCMMDLFGRTGCLNLASVVWHSIPADDLRVAGSRSVLSHCKTHGSLDVSKDFFDEVTL
ncbi:hypothetical protein GOP47_0027040 [Adiantum capillus-veneris]|nr:hypothetical protein GOP47_0027040 [Adiantum capillus-veneris]